MLEYFESLSPLTQILIVFGALGLLFLLVIGNNRKNKRKLNDRKGRNFRERYNERRNDK